MVVNGIGSSDVLDNDKYKSVTAAVHIKPRDKLQIGISFYNDVISANAELHHGMTVDEQINQQLYTGTIAHFGKKFELLAEGTFATNYAASTGTVNSFTSYLYAGFKIKEKFVPYIRFDYLKYSEDEIYFKADDTTSIVGGFRYEISYLIVVKIEYQNIDSQVAGNRNLLNTQIAIGF